LKRPATRRRNREKIGNLRPKKRPLFDAPTLKIILFSLLSRFLWLFLLIFRTYLPISSKNPSLRPFKKTRPFVNALKKGIFSLSEIFIFLSFFLLIVLTNGANTAIL